MSEADVALVRRWYELGPADFASAFTDERFIAAARPALEGFLAPDFVFLAGEDDFTGLAGEYRGLDGFLDFMREWYSAWSSFVQVVEDVIDAGEGRVLVLGRERGRSRSAGVQMDGEFGTVYHVHDGLIRRIDAFQNREKARQAAGLGRGPAARAAAARDLAAAGVDDAPIELVEYDPGWPALFEAERERLAPVLPGAEIQHIGSTAVPGLPAKPVIDLMALVDDLDRPVPALTASGYEYPEAFNAELHGRRWLCRPSAAHRTHHLHLVDDRDEIARHVHFRDRLRSDPALAEEYAALKRDLAARFAEDREAYSAAKSDFVRRVERG